MENVSQLILRNSKRIGAEKVLLVNPPRDTLHRTLADGIGSLRVSTQDRGDFRWLVANGANASFEVVPRALDEAGLVILTLPREKARLVMMLHALSSWMPDHARLWLAGENRAGIKSAPRHLGKFFQQAGKVDAARHCGLFEATRPTAGKPFKLTDYQRDWTFEHAGHCIQIISLPGVFAHGRLDPGSSLLLEVLEQIRLSGRILDFACGNGVIGISLLSQESSVELALSDASALAMESSRRSLMANSKQAQLIPSDGLTEINGTFDWIVSNPPFHRGVRNDLETTARFFAHAGTFLTKNGRILIVYNQHLPYEKWLKNHFKQVKCLAANREYRVIGASNARSQDFQEAGTR